MMKYLTEATQRRKKSFWLRVSEGSVHAHLAPCAWANLLAVDVYSGGFSSLLGRKEMREKK
jgi:hypothetical protein